MAEGAIEPSGADVGIIQAALQVGSAACLHFPSFEDASTLLTRLVLARRAKLSAEVTPQPIAVPA